MTDDKLREASERVAKRWLPGKLEVDSRETDEDSLCEKIRALTDENKRLKANQIPGRCGECAHFTPHPDGRGICEGLRKYTHISYADVPIDFYCHEWKPKE